MEQALVLAYKNAPKKIRVGRILMWIGCLLFFVTAAMNVVLFIVALATPDMHYLFDWSDASVSLRTYLAPFLCVAMVLAGIGGISYLRDKGPFKRFATLAAIILLVMFVIDTIVTIRNLIHNLTAAGATAAWLEFVIDLIDIQLSGGLYFIGWILVRDFTGD